MADSIHPNTAPPAGTQTYPSPKNSRGCAKNTRRMCCRCCCWLFFIAFSLIALLAIPKGLFLIIFRPKTPNYNIDRITVSGMNLSSLSAISPEFDVSVRAQNRNHKIGIYYYGEDSTVELFYRDIRLCNGVIPAFYQPSKNVTVIETVLKGSDIEIAGSDQMVLVNAVAKRSVPLTLKLRVPVKFKVGSIFKTWETGMKVDCDVTVDQLTAQANVFSNECSFDLTIPVSY